MNKGLISGLVLLVLGLVCGLLLATVNYFTAPIIRDQELAVKLAALEEFYDTDNYTVEEITVNEGAIEAAYLLKNKTTDALEAVVYSTSAQGYEDQVKLLIAIDSDYTIRGYKVISQKETKGIGDQVVTHDFNVTGNLISDLASFDGISGPTAPFTTQAVLDSFMAVQARVNTDLGGDV